VLKQFHIFSEAPFIFRHPINSSTYVRITERFGNHWNGVYTSRACVRLRPEWGGWETGRVGERGKVSG